MLEKKNQIDEKFVQRSFNNTSEVYYLEGQYLVVSSTTNTKKKF